ncbi:ATP-binding protein [Paraburkholderia sp.]|uniref:ATP-binding protein n=1 Tax=Paraburkholderia sp. TaxID=1926495 RepID=UPI00386213B0
METHPPSAAARSAISPRQTVELVSVFAAGPGGGNPAPNPLGQRGVTSSPAPEPQATDETVVQIGTLLVNFEQRDLRRDGRALRIAAPALDILSVLFRADGAVVSKNDIIDAVWPRQIVEENRLQVHIAALRKALGDDRDLIKTVSGRGYLLLKRAHDARSLSRAVGSASLPVRASTLIGRDDEYARILAQLIQLEPGSVLTLAGEGGVGKTALATRVAHEVRERGASVRFAALASAQTREDVVTAIALACEISPDVEAGESSLLLQIRETLRRDSALPVLVLDNAEQVIEPVAALVETLRSLRELRILITSREPLAIRAETVVRIEPLAVPPESASMQTMLAHGAVELFLQRARHFAPDSATNEVSIRRIADICRRLDGLPLAIELAAARVAVLGIEGVALRLHKQCDDRLDLLGGGLRSAPPRHQTLRATLDWSYALLDASARALLRNLALFAGAFTLDALCAVGAEPGAQVADVMATLDDLVAKSLLTVEFRGAIARYRLGESTRAYAMERLREAGALRHVAARHLRYLHHFSDITYRSHRRMRHSLAKRHHAHGTRQIRRPTTFLLSVLE